MSATTHTPTAAALLFSNAEGNPISLEDLIDEGFDGTYRDRIPAMVALLRGGGPRDRLYACQVLTAWGIAEGFDALIAWAQHPDAVPWAGQLIEIDRRQGADAAFERLADAVRCSLLLDSTPELLHQQRFGGAGVAWPLRTQVRRAGSMSQHPLRGLELQRVARLRRSPFIASIGTDVLKTTSLTGARAEVARLSTC
jgi:hypothetical protein